MFIPSFLSPKGNLAACLFQRLWNIGRFQNRMCQPLWQAVIPRAGSNPDVHSETSQICAWEREKPVPWKWELQKNLFQRAAWERALTVETASCSLEHTPPLPEMQGKSRSVQLPALSYAVEAHAGGLALGSNSAPQWGGSCAALLLPWSWRSTLAYSPNSKFLSLPMLCTGGWWAPWLKRLFFFFFLRGNNEVLSFTCHTFNP